MRFKKTAAKYSFRFEFEDFNSNTLKPNNIDKLADKLGTKFSNHINLGKLYLLVDLINRSYLWLDSRYFRAQLKS